MVSSDADEFEVGLSDALVDSAVVLVKRPAVEGEFDRLVETGVLTEKRVRHEVRLKVRGRNIASEAIADQ